MQSTFDNPESMTRNEDKQKQKSTTQKTEKMSNMGAHEG